MAERQEDRRNGGDDAEVDRSGNGRWPRRQDRRRYAQHSRKIPIFRLIFYYAVLLGIGLLGVYFIPGVQKALVSPLGGTAADAGAVTPKDLLVVPARTESARVLTTTLAVIATLLLVLPIAWVYTFARRLRYDRSLVHTLIMLPPVVTGTVMVVKNSVALAFGLAGIVAAVRFRTTVKDPKDAVHVFLVMAIGLSCGVQAADIAFVLSLTFAIMVLIFWKYDLEVYVDEDAELLSVGDTSMMIAQTRQGQDRVRSRLEELTDQIKTDGILLIHTTEPRSARQVAEVVLSEIGKEWLFHEPPRGRNGVYTLEAAVRLRKKKTPVDILGELEDRWSPTVAAAEYVPYHPREDDE